MKKIVLWISKYAALVFFVILVITHLGIINDYGATWDFHFHFFGGGHLLGYSWQQLEARALPYVEPDPRNAWSLPYGPLMSIPPVASFLYFYKILHLLPADSAYNLPIILWGIAGIAIVYFFLKEALSSRISILAALFLALTPRYFGDMHNNMKDIPSAVVFALNIWLLWRLVNRKRLIDLFLAVAAFAVAFNVKINSIYIPIVFIAWILVTRGGVSIRSIITALAAKNVWRKKDSDFDDARTSAHRLARKKENFTTTSTLLPYIFWYIILAPIAAYLLWWFFWPNPIAQLDHAYRTFAIGTNNIEVILNSKWYCSGSTVPWYYPFWYLTITTPLPILILFFIGLIGLIRHIRPIGILLSLWLFLPLTRYLFPNIGVIDGVRHFEEVLFPIAAIAAIGLDRIRPIGLMRLISLICVFFLGFTLFLYHPYQIAYFNELVGGARGAFGKYDLDYWGTSQKAAVEWVNTHAPQHATVHIVMAADVAGTYLRPDLLTNLNHLGYDQSDYVIVLNRQSFFYRFFYIYEYLLVHKPVHTIEVAGAPLTWIFDNRTNNVTPRHTPWWHGEDPCILKYWRGEHR